MQNVLFFFIEVAFCMVTIVSAQIPESDTVLQVQYGSVTFKTGEKLRLSDITSAPSIGLSAPALTGTYIVIMIDPDAPDPTLPIFTQVLHWVQQDLIFSPMAGKYNTFVPLITPSPAPAAAPYLPPMPPPLLAPHRYIQTLFRQPAEFSINDLDLYLADSILRFGFNLSRFAQENMLGEPIASNFFLAGDETIQIR